MVSSFSSTRLSLTSCSGIPTSSRLRPASETWNHTRSTNAQCLTMPSNVVRRRHQPGPRLLLRDALEQRHHFGAVVVHERQQLGSLAADEGVFTQVVGFSHEAEPARCLQTKGVGGRDGRSHPDRRRRHRLRQDQGPQHRTEHARVEQRRTRCHQPGHSHEPTRHFGVALGHGEHPVHIASCNPHRAGRLALDLGVDQVGSGREIPGGRDGLRRRLEHALGDVVRAGRERGTQRERLLGRHGHPLAVNGIERTHWRRRRRRIRRGSG